jgi:hypothetical protein
MANTHKVVLFFAWIYTKFIFEVFLRFIYLLLTTLGDSFEI